jgi:hypothetical protein
MKAPRLLLCLLLPVLAAGVSCSRQAADPRVVRFQQLPDWRGYWVSAVNDVDISGYPVAGTAGFNLQLIGFGPGVPWKEGHVAEAQAQLARVFPKGDGQRKGTGWGYPIMMELVPPTQFLVTPEETLIINSYRDTRHVYTDGRAHPPEQDRWPTPWGDSIGHWEGDTLVIDTVSVQQPNVILMSNLLAGGPGAPRFGLLPPLSEQAHYIERLRRSGPDSMEMQMTIEDPQTLVKPWVVKLAYKRAAAMDRMFHEAFQNDRSVPDGDSATIAPPKN